MRIWAWITLTLLYLMATLSTGLAWLFGTNRYVWMGEGEYCDLDSPGLIRLLSVVGLLLTLVGAAVWLFIRRGLSARAWIILAVLTLLLLGASALRWDQATAAYQRQVASGCAGATQ